MRVYGNRAGVPNVSPKVFPITLQSVFLLNGGDIFTLSKILGHSSVAITEAAYLDLTDDDLREQYQRFSPVAKYEGLGSESSLEADKAIYAIKNSEICQVI